MSAALRVFWSAAKGMQRVSRGHMFWCIVPDLMSDDREDPAADSKQQVCDL